MLNITRRATAAALLCTCGLSLGLGPDHKVKREGEPERRAVADKLEGTEFNFDLLAGLDGWVNTDAAITPQHARGKPVVLAFWSDDKVRSVRILSSLNRLQRDYDNEDFVVIAVHPEELYTDATGRADRGLVQVPLARDPQGKLHEALKADDAPDIYLVDRAGQLRYADIEESSLRRALRNLIRETPEEALAALKKEREARAEEIAAAQEAAADNAGDEAQPAPEAEKPRPDPGVYNIMRWPPRNTDAAVSRAATNLQGQAFPASRSEFAALETIRQGEDPTDRVVIVDMWESWCGPCIAAGPKLERIQNRFRGQLAIVAISGPGSDTPRPGNAKEEAAAIVERENKNFGYYYDANDTIKGKLGIRAIPHVYVLSTDGVVRWQGNPHDAAFERIVGEIVAQDPLLRMDRGEPIPERIGAPPAQQND